MTHVREFHIAMGIPAHDRPGIPDIKRVELRRRLIQEEFKEVEAEFAIILTKQRFGGYKNVVEYYEDIARLAKELADLRYVLWGTDLEFGIPSEDVDAEVHRSNMSKLWPDGRARHRHDGKVLKPPTYSEADILSIIGFIDAEGESIT